MPTYLLFDAKSQLLQSPEPTPVKLDILNSWLAAVSCGRLWCLADGLPDFLDFVTISRHHWWPTGSPLILFTHCPLFLKVMYNMRNGIIVWRFWGITAVLSPKTAFYRNERSRFVPKLYYFYFSSAGKTIADSDLIFWHLICLNITYLVWPKVELSLKKNSVATWLQSRHTFFGPPCIFWDRHNMPCLLCTVEPGLAL